MRQVLMQLIILVAISALLCPVSDAQERSPADSAQTLWRSGEKEKALMLLDSIIGRSSPENWEDVYEAIVYKVNLVLFTRDLDSIRTVLDQGSELARIWDIQEFRVRIENFYGQTLKMMGDSPSAYGKLQSVLSQSVPYPEHSSILQEYAILKYQLYNEVDSARIYLDSARQVVYRYNDSVRTTSVLEAVGQLYAMTGSYMTAADAYIEAIALVVDKAPLKKFTLLHKVGQMFRDLGQLGKAKDYCTQALDFAVEHDFARSVATSQNTLGTIALDEKNYHEAVRLFELSDVYSTQGMSNNHFVSVKVNLASALLSIGRVNDAHLKLEEATQRLEGSDKIFQSRYYRELGRLALTEQRYRTAVEYLDLARQLSKEGSSPLEEVATLKFLQEAFTRIGDYRNALAMADQRETLSDSLFQLRQAQLIYDTEARYQKAEQDKVISQLNAENEIKDITLAAKNRQLLLGGFALLAIFAVALLIYRAARIRKNSNRLLAEKNALISTALEEKELLLREIHHRVKNNVQVVSSLLSLQSQFVEDQGALKAIKEGRDRVKSMALIHQNLYQEDNLTGIQIKAYFEKLIHGLFHSYNIAPDHIKLEQRIEDINLDIDTVIPLGLIVNELVSNALKYAFPDQREGKITVSLREDGDALTLQVTDNGIGMTKDWTEEESDSFGYRLIHAFKDKLEAELDVTTEDGTAITMQIRDYQKAG